MDGLVGKITLGIIRHFVTAAFAALAAKGLIDQSASEQAIGAVMVLIPIAFSAWDKVHAHAALQDAQDVAAQQQ